MTRDPHESGRKQGRTALIKEAVEKGAVLVTPTKVPIDATIKYFNGNRFVQEYIHPHWVGRGVR